MMIPITLLLAYCISTACFLIMAIFNSHLRKMSPRYLSTANIIAAVAAFFILIFLAINLNKAEQTDGAHYFYHRADYLKVIILHVAACLLTLFRKPRRNVLFTLILIVIYCFCIFKEAPAILFTGHSGDHRPSSWAYYYSASDLYILVYAAVYLAICYFIAAKPVSGNARR